MVAVFAPRTAGLKSKSMKPARPGPIGPGRTALKNCAPPGPLKVTPVMFRSRLSPLLVISIRQVTGPPVSATVSRTTADGASRKGSWSGTVIERTIPVGESGSLLGTDMVVVKAPVVVGVTVKEMSPAVAGGEITRSRGVGEEAGVAPLEGDRPAETEGRGSRVGDADGTGDGSRLQGGRRECHKGRGGEDRPARSGNPNPEAPFLVEVVLDLFEFAIGGQAVVDDDLGDVTVEALLVARDLGADAGAGNAHVQRARIRGAAGVFGPVVGDEDVVDLAGGVDGEVVVDAHDGKPRHVRAVGHEVVPVVVLVLAEPPDRTFTQTSQHEACIGHLRERRGGCRPNCGTRPRVFPTGARLWLTPMAPVHALAVLSRLTQSSPVIVARNRSPFLMRPHRELVQPVSPAQPSPLLDRPGGEPARPTMCPMPTFDLHPPRVSQPSAAATAGRPWTRAGPGPRSGARGRRTLARRRRGAKVTSKTQLFTAPGRCPASKSSARRTSNGRASAVESCFRRSVGGA